MFRHCWCYLNERSSKVGRIFERIVKLLALPQIVKAELVFDHLMGEVNLPPVGMLDMSSFVLIIGLVILRSIVC